MKEEIIKIKNQCLIKCFRCDRRINTKYTLENTEYKDLKLVDFNVYCLRCKKKRKEKDIELLDFHWELYNKLNEFSSCMNA